MNDTEFRVTVYTNQGYTRILTIQSSLRQAGYETSITQGGLTVYGNWTEYDGFVIAMMLYPEATYIGGESVHRTPQPPTEYVIADRRISTVNSEVIQRWKARREAP